MIRSLPSLKVIVLFICLYYKLVSFRGLYKLRPRPDWSLLGVKFKISDEHPRPFYMGFPPPPPPPGVGSKTYNLLRDLLAPAKPSTMKYAELVETLQSHYEPKPLVIAERFHFHKRDQLEGESVAEYSAVLKKCSERCEFKAFLEEALRDRFVCGLRSKATQKRLLAEVELTWKKAIQTAQAMEAAEKQATNFRNAPPHMEKINALKSRPKNNPNFKRSDAGKTSKPWLPLW